MRNFIYCFVFSFILLSCAPTVSSIPNSEKSGGGTPYTLPKGLVPVQVFADSKGVGITIEPAKTAIDTEAGTLVARLSANAMNNEDIKITSDPATGFLSTISSSSDAQLLAIAEEAAKSAARLAFQNSRAAFLENKVVVMEDSFDPLEESDVERINTGVSHAVAQAARAFVGATGEQASIQPVELSVTFPNGRDSFSTSESAISSTGSVPRQSLSTNQCRVGICVRTMTSRIVRIEVGGKPFAGKLVNIPARELTPVPVPSTALADQDITITIEDGILKKNELKRESEVLGLVKVPGAAVSGFVSGVTQGLTDEKSIIDKRKELAQSEEAFEKAAASRDQTIASLGRDSVNLQNATAGADVSSTDYAAATLTVYPFADALARALAEAIERSERRERERELNMEEGGGLLGASPGDSE